jgi:lipopolysaccharide cholinephosphotransferase
MEELTLREIQKNSLQVLLKFKEICEENNFTYYLAYGTLIGAVRHNGFIPWDDDIDVWMPRRDYEKFIQYCIDNEENVKPFELKHYRTCKEYIYAIARLSDSRYKINYKNAKDYGLGLFIDIYPLDGINPNDKKFLRRLEISEKFIWSCGTNHFVPTKKIIRTILKFPYYLLTRMVNLNKLLKKQDLLAQKYDFESSEYFTCTVWESKEVYKKSDINNVLIREFEGEQMPIPVGYDEILKCKYGNYMKLPPEKERIAHHFYEAYRR